jgi:broad specificity phosphatase PhoE
MGLRVSEFNWVAPRDFCVFFLRHGDAAVDPGVYPNHYKMPLSELGHLQASQVATFLREVPFQRVISSPLRRCVETADAFGSTSGIEVEYDSRLVERVFEPLFARSYDDIAREYGSDCSSSLSSGNSDLIDLEFAESLESCQARVWESVRDAIKDGRGPVLFVSHGGPHEWLLKKILGLFDWSTPRRNFYLAKCGVTVLAFPDRTPENARILHANLEFLDPAQGVRTVPTRTLRTTKK